MSAFTIYEKVVWFFGGDSEIEVIERNEKVGKVALW